MRPSDNRTGQQVYEDTRDRIRGLVARGLDVYRRELEDENVHLQDAVRAALHAVADEAASQPTRAAVVEYLQDALARAARLAEQERAVMTLTAIRDAQISVAALAAVCDRPAQQASQEADAA